MGRDNLPGFYGVDPPRLRGCPCCGQGGVKEARLCPFCGDQEHQHGPDDIYVGDFVAANDYAQEYYFAEDSKAAGENSDYNRRSLEFGIVTDVHHGIGFNEPAIQVKDIIRDLTLSMKPSTLRIVDVTWTIEEQEQLFDLPEPTYRHF